MPILNEIETLKAKVIDFIKRPVVAIILIIAIALSLYLIISSAGDKQKKVIAIAQQLEEKENAAKTKFYSQIDTTAIPQTLLLLGEADAINKVKITPEYKALQTELNSLQTDKDSYSIFQLLLIIILGFILVPLFTGVALFLCTKFHFINFLIKEPDGIPVTDITTMTTVQVNAIKDITCNSQSYNTEISKGILKFLGIVFTCFSWIYLIVMAIGIYVAFK